MNTFDPISERLSEIEHAHFSVLSSNDWQRIREFLAAGKLVIIRHNTAPTPEPVPSLTIEIR